MSTYQRAELLERALWAIAGQSYPAELFDVVVVDNGSTDATPDVLDRARCELGDRLRVLRNPSNTSAAEARNRAIEVATGSIVAFTDDDCRPTPGWLQALVDGFDGDTVALVQGRTVPDPSQPLTPTSRSQWTLSEHGLYETCNIAYRRSALLAAGDGPFRSDLSDQMARLLGSRIGAMAFGEDVDLAWRVRRLGGDTRFMADAVVHHHVFESDVPYLLRRSLQAAGFPMLVRDYPELRHHFLYRRYFLTRRHALALGALLSLLTSSRTLVALVVTAYAWNLVRPGAPGRRRRVAGAPLRTARDVIETLAMVYGSVRTRALVL